MNIKSFFKKPIIASFLVVGALGMVVTTAYSTFYFANNFNISEQASPIGDAIRANQTFGEESDVVVNDVEYYDVVFLAQNVDITSKLTPVEGGTNEYKSNDSLWVYGQQGYYGKWIYDETNWPGESTQSNYIVNNCYIGPRIYRNVAEVTNGMLDDLSNPNVLPVNSKNNSDLKCGLLDRSSEVNDNKFYYLNFMGWGLSHDDYTYARYSGNTPDDSIDYHYVSGSYSTTTELARFNTLLSIYKEYAITIDGRKTIVFYPMYSTGKDNYSYDAGNTDKLKECVEIFTNSGSLFFSYDYEYSETLKNTKNTNLFKPTSGSYLGFFQLHYYGVKYEAYRYTNLLINESNLNSVVGNYIIRNDINRYGSSWAGNEDSRNIFSNFPLNGQIGRYNIYFFVKESYDTGSRYYGDYYENGNFTGDQIDYIDSMLRNDGIYIYKSYLSNTFAYEGNIRGTYIVVERVYEPRVIGGSSLALDYNNPQSYKLNFTRQGTNGIPLRSYELRNRTVNVPSSDNDPTLKYIDYTFYNDDGTPRRQYLIPAYYFAIQVALDQKTIYDQKLYGQDNTNPNDSEFTDSLDPNLPEKYDVPVYKYKDINGNEKTEFYSSKKYLVSLQDVMDGKYTSEDGNTLYTEDLRRIKVRTYNNGAPSELKSLAEWGKGFAEWNAVYNNVKLIRFKVTGTYNIYTIINYDENNRPNSVDIWTYRLHNIFVNIYDPDDFEGQILEVGANYLDTSKYSYRCEDYYYLETPILGTDNYVRQTGLTIPSEIGVSGNIVTFEQLLKYYDQKEKRLQDVVTGEYVEYQDYVENPFIVRKNYFLQVVPK